MTGIGAPKLSLITSLGDCGDPVLLLEERQDVTDEGLFLFRSEEEVEGEMKPLLLFVLFRGTAREFGRVLF